MSKITIKNKIIVMIILASIFQLISFIFSQIVINIDEELEKNNYNIISNEIKLEDLDINIRHILPDLYLIGLNHKLNLIMYEKYYSNVEYKLSLTKNFNHLKLYLKYIEKDFFINHDLIGLDIEENNYDMKNFNFILNKISDAGQKLQVIEEKVIDDNINLNNKKDSSKKSRHLMNIGIIITQIFNLFFLSLFFLFAFDNYKKPKILKE